MKDANLAVAVINSSDKAITGFKIGLLRNHDEIGSATAFVVG